MDGTDDTGRAERQDNREGNERRVDLTGIRLSAFGRTGSGQCPDSKMVKPVDYAHLAHSTKSFHDHRVQRGCWVEGREILSQGPPGLCPAGTD
jgi:hypothetical protein